MHNLHYGSSSNGNNNNNNVEWMFRSASLRTHWERLLSLSVLSGDNETMIPFGLRSANTAEWNWLKLLCYRGCYFYSFVRFSGSRFSASWIQTTIIVALYEWKKYKLIKVPNMSYHHSCKCTFLFQAIPQSHLTFLVFAVLWFQSKCDMII